MDTLQTFLLVAPVLLFSMVAHEYAHGYAALKQGDPTAYQLGRLTWNPVKHIDPFLTILMPLLTWFGSGGRIFFGGAKPVPVTPRNYRNYKRGDIIVSLAGVATNLVIALALTVLVALLGLLGRLAPGPGTFADTLSLLQYMSVQGIGVNFMLVAFNLLPIPPLDGSHVLKHLLPPAWSMRYQQIASYGFLVLILFLTVGRGLLSMWMAPALVATRALVGSVEQFLIPSQWWG